jgi:aminoglycoside phosphotransferase (APT) family kinase protein
MTSVNLTVDTATPYLLANGLVDVAAIVGGDLEIRDIGRRNQSLKVVRRGGEGYLIKQAGEGEWATRATLRREASFYSQVCGDEAAAALRAHLPAFRGWDEARCLMTLELIDGRTLWDYYAAAGDEAFPADAAAPLGEALGALHRLFRDPSADAAAGSEGAMPWILAAHRPAPEVFARLSPANLRLLILIQQDVALAGGLEALRRAWRPDTMVHNDLKGDNILVKSFDGGTRVCLIDWELIQRGDAAWDVGAIFRDFLTYWLLAVPLSADLAPEAMLNQALLPMAALRPAVRAFWRAYLGAAGIGGGAAGATLLRSVEFAAARMAQAAYELSLGQADLSNLALAMLQLAANILTDPREASLHLLGIPIPWYGPVHAPAIV